MNRITYHIGIACVLSVAVALYCGSAMAQGNGNGNGNGGGNGGGGNNPPPYTVVDLLGLPGGNVPGSLQSQAVAVNEPDESGVVQLVGNSYEQGDVHPAKWSVSADGSQVTITDVGLMPGETAGVAEDINDRGTYVFHTNILDDPQNPNDQSSAAWVVVPGLDPQELPLAGGTHVRVEGINNSDIIVGIIGGAGALWRLDSFGIPSAPIDLGSFLPYDISDNGIMAGEDDSDDDGYADVAAIATLDSNDNLIVEPLGVLPGHSSSAARAISNNGTYVVGRSRSPSNQREGFIWSAGTGMVGLGRLGGWVSDAYDVNNAGQVVGRSDTGGGRWSQTAVLWSDGQIIDLNSMADTRAHLARALSINDFGHIAGFMGYPRPISEQHGFLLIPNPSD